MSARFVPDSGDEISCGAAATSIKLELRAVYTAPENPCANRHVYGVGEKVDFELLPKITAIQLSASKGDVNDIGYLATEYDTFAGASNVNCSEHLVYTCPIASTYVPDIKVTYCGVEYQPVMDIVEPQNVITRGASWGENGVSLDYVGNRMCWPLLSVGEATLVTTNYIGPMHVSFQGIAVSEVPCSDEDIITGCFSNGHFRTHGYLAGAGRAKVVQEGNFWFVDAAGSKQATQNWSPGSRLVWKIPIGWHRRLASLSANETSFGVQQPDYERSGDPNSRHLLIGGRIDLYKQERYIDDDGVFRTDKYGHWISRSRWCHVILDGVDLQMTHPLW